jgi:predicted transcriptional regulator of viral defense system
MGEGRKHQIMPFLVKNMSTIFPDYELAEKGKVLPGNRMVDLQFKDKDGNDVFVECKSSLTKNQLGDMIDLYSAVLNSSPEPRNPKFMIIGDRIDKDAKKELSKLNVTTTTYRKLGVPISKLLTEQRLKRKQELTPTEARIVAGLENDKRRIVSADLLSNLIGHNNNYAKLLLHRLEKKRWFERISKGNYVFIPPEYGYGKEERFPPLDPFLVASGLIEPYYLSYSTANAHYGFTAQVPSVLYIATTKKKLQFAWRNITFRFVTLSEEKFFGFKQIEVDNVEINVAEPEKAVIDSVDKLRYGGGLPEVVTVIYHSYNKIDKQKLASYAKRMNSSTLCQKLGFIIDFLGTKEYITPDERILQDLRSMVRSPLYLDNDKPRGGRYIKDWRLYDNVEDDELLSEMRIA